VLNRVGTAHHADEETEEQELRLHYVVFPWGR
jgi:hypothetical protein